ncbi:glutamate--cysteine ligase [Streptomyces sp. NPDC004667]|uniref:carboxylate-amine ligase n=1 Tax=Streptomyces sp. NPDC004667 TaxID=3154285 RepID=UPI0033BB71E5
MNSQTPVVSPPSRRKADGVGPATPADARPTSLTCGIEEEYLLVDAVTLQPAPVATEVREIAAAEGLETQAEGTLHQVEVATAAAGSVLELRDELLRARGILTRAAAALGCRLVAAAGPVLPPAEPLRMNFDPPRRRNRIERFGLLSENLVSCGRHVHVGTLSRARAVAASNTIRQWIPTLIALSANSPFWKGHDTGHATWRTVAWSSWPSAGLPPHLTSVDHYEQCVRTLIGSGAALDAKMVYWDVRPGTGWPTVETRALDVSANLGLSAALAALCRALVASSLRQEADGARHPTYPEELLRLARWRACRDGLEGYALDPRNGLETPALALVDALVDHLAEPLASTGDLDHVVATVERLRRHGSGAARQRAAFARRGRLEDVVRLLADETEHGSA